jgi:hypothetical protein
MDSEKFGLQGKGRGDRYLRVPIRWEMDLEPEDPFIEFHHMSCPFCMEHAPTRIFEGLMEAILHCAQQQPKGMKRLIGNLQASNMGWVPRKMRDSNAWAKVQFGQHTIPRKMVAAIYNAVQDNALGCNWLSGVLPPRLERVTMKQIADLHIITRVGRKALPNKEERQQFMDACRNLPMSIALTWPAKFTTGLYLHCLYAHGAEYMAQLKSLGRFMQSNMEKNQKIANAAMRHSQMGGGKGSIIMTHSGEMARVKQQGIQAVMERRSRALMQSYWRYCDIDWLHNNTQAQQVDRMWKRVKTFEFGAHADEWEAGGNQGTRTHGVTRTGADASDPQSPRHQVPALNEGSTSGAVRSHDTLTPQKLTPGPKRHRR